MSRVDEYVRLYAADESISPEWFRAMVHEAAELDAEEAAGDRTELIAAMIDDRLRALLGTIDALAEAVGLLNQLDTDRDVHLTALSHRVEALSRVIGSEVEYSRKAAS